MLKRRFFPKAIQNTEAYNEYMLELLKYSNSCREFKAISKRCKASLDPALRLLYWEARERHSQNCKRFHDARERYVNAQAEAALAERGIDIKKAQIVDILSAFVPTSFSKMREAAAEQVLVESITPEEIEAYSKGALEAHAQAEKERSRSEQEQFLHPTDEAHEVRPDPTDGDFKPL